MHAEDYATVKGDGPRKTSILRSHGYFNDESVSFMLLHHTVYSLANITVGLYGSIYLRSSQDKWTVNIGVF